MGHSVLAELSEAGQVERPPVAALGATGRNCKAPKDETMAESKRWDPPIVLNHDYSQNVNSKMNRANTMMTYDDYKHISVHRCLL